MTGKELGTHTIVVVDAEEGCDPWPEAEDGVGYAWPLLVRQ